MKSKIIAFFFILAVASFKGVLIEYVPPVKLVDTYLLLLSDIFITVLGLSALPKAPKAHIWGLIFLLFVSSVNFLNGPMSNFLMHVNGLREITNLYFLFIFFYSLFFSGYQYYFNHLFKYFAYIFLFSQIPVSIIQFLKYGASDDVGGTLGAGNSGILTLSIFILVYYLIENRSHHTPDFSKFKYLASKIYFFIPVLLNETKITFLLIPIFVISLVNFKKVRSLLVAVILAGALFFLFGDLFTGYGSKSYGTSAKDPIAEIFNKDYLEEYLSGQVRGGEIDVPRFTKLVLGIKLLTREDINLLFGQEYGAFKGGTTLGLTSFAAKYLWLLQGSRPYLFYVLITGGISLILLIFFLFIKVIMDKPYHEFENFSNGLLLFLSSIFIIVLFYNDAFRGVFFILIFVYVLFFGKYFNTPVGLIRLDNKWIMV